jgi:CBS domain containing-hemolysin-like protein
MSNALLPAAEAMGTGALLLLLLTIVVLVALNALFVSAEFALLGSRASRMEELSEDGNRTARALLPILQHPDRQNGWLATCQLGITVVTLGLAMYAEPKIASLLEPPIQRFIPDITPTVLHTIGYIVSIGMLTWLHVVLGEMVPKSIALIHPTETLLGIWRIMKPLQWVLRGPVWLLNSIGNALLRIFRIPPAHLKARLYSTEELEQLVSESMEGGLMTEDAEEMISNIFDFSGREVGQIMTPRRMIEGISADTPWDELLTTVTGSSHTRFPVYENDLDHIIGILHLKDLVRHQLGNGNPVGLRELVRPTPVVPSDYLVEDLLKLFKNERIHMAVVLDEYGGVAGIVTLEDLVEEIVGEVRDEFDVEREPYVEVAPGVLEVEGSYLVEDLQDDVWLGPENSLPDVDTVGGLVVTRLGRPPVLNDVVKLENDITFTVTAVDGRAITRVRVEFPAPAG